MSISKHFTKDEIIRLLEACLDKSLGEIDKNNVFDKTIGKPKITGIAGDVVEQSVLGYPSDNKQEPDIYIDNNHFEVKTTGIKKLKKKTGYVAKEPMSITAVSPKTIVNEEFRTSKFFHKIERMLMVYYLYNSDVVVKASEYRHFPVKGYELKILDDEDISVLENDWKTVKEFIKCLQDNCVNYKDEYPRISSELRPKLMYIDTAPKWPNPPRFRFKQSFVTRIVQDHFGKELEQLPIAINSLDEVDYHCRRLVTDYGSKSIREICTLLNIKVAKQVDKGINETVVVKMFGGKASKINSIAIFNKAGIIGKTITLTQKGLRTEDMKLFKIDFNEIFDESLKFEESQFFDYFANYQLLCLIFEEPTKGENLLENKFIGFRRITFDDDFIDTNVKPVWNEIRRLVMNKKLIDVADKDKFGNLRANKTGVIRSAPNFPKSRNNNVFVRGSGTDSKHKTLVINDIKMYAQYLWIKGSFISELIHEAGLKSYEASLDK